MLSNPRLQDDLDLLVEAGEWSHVRNFFGIWDSEDEQIDKFFLFCHYFFPHYFRDASPVFHREIARAYFSKANEYEAAPRGFSKTTLFQGGILFDCVNELEKFIPVIEKTFTEASELLEAVRAECVENARFVQVYGDLLANDKSIIASRVSKSKDAEGDFFINGVRLRAKGFDQPIRGLKSREWRPTKILMDDVEQDQHINSPEQRAKYESNYNKGIQPAVDKLGRVKVFGTILHADSLLSNLIRLHKGRIFRAFYLVSDGPEWDACKSFTTEELVEIEGVRTPVRLLWASRWSWADLMRKKADMVSKNQSSNAFEQEYRNNPIAEEERKFKYEWLHNPDRTIRLSELKKKGLQLVGYAAIDAAKSTKDTADDTASVVELIDTQGNWYRAHVRASRINIKGLLDLIFEIWLTWSKMGLIKIGVERDAFEDQVKPLFEDECRRRNVYPVVEELKPMGRSKESRIEGALQGRYEYGRIWTVLDDRDRPVGHTETLLDQLYAFPGSPKDDLSDAEAYISDLVVTPLEEEKKPTAPPPQDDPFEIVTAPSALRTHADSGYDVPESGTVNTEEDPY